VTTRHLGKRLYLLVDGRLDRADAIEAMTHLEDCEACTNEWREILRAREALQTSGSGIDMRFARRLLDRDRIAEIAQAEPKRHVKVASGVRPHVVRATALGTVATIAVLSVLYALGEPDRVGIDSLASANAENGPVRVVGEEGPDPRSLDPWAHPVWDDSEFVPISAWILDDDGVPMLQATVLLGEHEMLITERKGRLVVRPDDAVVRAEDTSREVYLVDGDDSAVVFESADAVVMIGCTCPMDSLLGAVDEFPEASGQGVLARLGSGVGEVADAVTGR
jgi:hypothetical protein